MEFTDYYIAYFDVLGCKSFFEVDESTALDFLVSVRQMIDSSVNVASLINQSMNLKDLPDMKVEYKLFSDNVALYLKVTDSKLEIIRVLTFLEVIADLQKNVLFRSKLLLRGGVIKGKMYSDDTLIMGQALIDAVKLESSAEFPRICLDKSIIETVNKLIADLHDTPFLTQAGMREWLNAITATMYDGKAFLNYLYAVDIKKVYPILEFDCTEVFEEIKQKSLKEYENVQKELASSYIEKISRNLETHKQVVLDNIKKYCNFEGVDISDSKAVAIKVSVIRKYKWLVVYHNLLCSFHKKEDCVLTVNYSFDPATLNDYMSWPVPTNNIA